MENNSYFTYFSEIEDRFCQRRGSILLLSTLDWALIETWKDAGIPLEAVLRGIDNAFDKYDARPRKAQKINALAYCSQAVLAAAEDIKAAAEGATCPEPTDTGLEAANVATYLTSNANKLEALLPGTDSNATGDLRLFGDGAVPRPGTGRRTVTAPSPTAKLPGSVCELVRVSCRTLRELADGFSTPPTGATSVSPEGAQENSPVLPCRVSAADAPESGREDRRQGSSLEDLERRLTVMEEKLFAALLAATPDDQLVSVRTEADRELGPYRRQMSGPQIEQLHQQYVHKRLLERYGVPRLSLFYMQ